jgi:DNA-binding CsgD family transcriptional regulator
VTLDDRVRDVLGRLQMLAEGSTSNLDPNKISRTHAESKAPVGATFDSSDRPPEKAHCTLYEWYLWHFADAEGDDHRIASLILVAEMDYRDFRFHVAKRVELRSGELTDNDRADGGKAEEKHQKRVVDWYEGVPVLVVALLEEQRVEWVKKARRLHARNAEDGRPRPEFLAWDDDRRRREITALASNDMGAKRIADKLGVSKQTVQRYLPKEAVEREPVAA